MSEKFQLHYYKCIHNAVSENKGEEIDDRHDLIDHCQTFYPLYNSFFRLTAKNWNRIVFNNPKHFIPRQVVGVGGGDGGGGGEYHVWNYESNQMMRGVPVFKKYAPLLDPIRYMMGKYSQCLGEEKSHLLLPSLESGQKVYGNTGSAEHKIHSSSNAAYIDSFFCFLTGCVAYQYHDFIHGVEYFGSYLGIQKCFEINVIDEVDYLHDSSFFMKHLGSLFYVNHHFDDDDDDDSAASVDDGDEENRSKSSHKNKKRLVTGIDDDGDIVNMNIDVDLDIDPQQLHGVGGGGGSTKPEAQSLMDVTDADLSSPPDPSQEPVGVVVDERDDHEDDDEDEDEDDDEEEEDEEDEDDDYDDYDDDDDGQVTASIFHFPVQMICMEQCEATIDSLFEEGEMTEMSSASMVFQIIMILITYQKMFDFTHNDLHTNNVMYTRTEHEFLYYLYDSQWYKVPTYGRIFKIIDFGRAIYRFQGKIFCSDSFNKSGDAHTQYNTEPFYNPKKPRVDPNPSFDLTRFATSVYDFIIFNTKRAGGGGGGGGGSGSGGKTDIHDFDLFQKLIYKWCLDDKGHNILYTPNGDERYPQFQLYKMIAKNVHNHTPQTQLRDPLFASFLCDCAPDRSSPLPPPSDRASRMHIVNIDDLPSYI